MAYLCADKREEFIADEYPARGWDEWHGWRDVATGKLLSFKVTNPEEFNGEEITVIDDLCDGGGTFVGIASELRKLNPTKIRLVVTHAVNYDGILKVASVYDEVVITNSYKNWGVDEVLPSNVRVNDILIDRMLFNN